MAHGDSTLAIPDGRELDEAIVNILMHMDETKSDQDRAADRHLEQASVLREAGLDGFALCSDYCFNSGPFLSPAMFSELVTPYLTRLVKGYRDLGMYVIKHTDGNIMPILDDLVSSGPHALHSLDPMAGVDIGEIKRCCGHKVCLIGNVNCALMQTGTKEQVLESCRYAMENGKPGGGYIFSTSNVIFKGMPRESYDLMLGYYREHCAY
jgi:uroporphyrinogen decarboxylase